MSSNEPASGIKTLEDGTRYVGGSVRADGTVRKTVKVRPGYVPQEDVAKYVPRSRRQAEDNQSAIQPVKQPKDESQSKPDRSTRRVVKSPNTNNSESQPVRRTRRLLNDDNDDDDLTAKLEALSVDDDNKAKGESSRKEEESTANSDIDKKLSPEGLKQAKGAPTNDESGMGNGSGIKPAKTSTELGPPPTSKSDVPKYVPPWKRKANTEKK